jgi:hypothetical protein
MARLALLLFAGLSLCPATARAERLPRGPLRLRADPCAPVRATGAELRCSLVGTRLPRPASYFEQHALRVEHDLLHFNAPYTLAQLRDRDRLRLYGPTAGGPGSIAAGIGLFGGVVLGAAHAPGAARILYDRRVHLGPAIFDGGGMGAGVGGTL